MMRLATALLIVSLAVPAWAQILPRASDPGAIQQRQIEEERRREEMERLQRKPITKPITPPEPQKPAVKSAPDAVRFKVHTFDFTPSEILTKEELEAIARDYRDKELTLADLQQLAERVNELYRSKGVVTARAVIPPQDVSSGVVQIRLVEGRYGRIRLEGNDSTSADYVRWRLGQEPGALVDLNVLERELIRFNRTTDVQARAELKPGESFGTTDLHLMLLEPPRHDLRLFIDNAGSKNTGEWRQGVSYLNRSVFGWRDDLSLSANRADGVESYALGYGVPINRWGGRARYGFYKDYTEITDGPLEVLDITGRSEAHILSLRQPTYVSQSVQLDLTAGYTKRNSANWISGVFLQSTKTETGNIGLEVQASGVKGYGLASYYLTSGHAAVSGSGRESYTIGRGSLRGIYDLGRWSARAAVSFQHSGDRLLPSSEQIFIGGEGSVRGYPVGVYSGDRGYIASMELHHPLGASGGGREGSELAATGFVFADYGNVKPFRPPNTALRSYEELSSLGFGVNATLFRRVSARVTFAYALNDLPQESGRYMVHCQLVASLF